MVLPPQRCGTHPQRRAVLNAQGGVSIAACIGAFILLMIVGSLCSMLLGPDLNALVGTFI